MVGWLVGATVVGAADGAILVGPVDGVEVGVRDGKATTQLLFKSAFGKA